MGTLYNYIIEQRNSFDDEGRQMQEISKKDLSSIIIANFKRVQEYLRVLKEYSKNFCPGLSLIAS
jgi:hypothetical protein